MGDDQHPEAQNRQYLDSSQRLRESDAPVQTFDVTSVSSSVDLRDKCPPVYNQLHLQSCTANALAAAFEFDEMKQGIQDVGTPSRLFIYYNERAQEGDPEKDAGAFTGDGVKGMQNLGVVSETDWPYDPAQVFTKPSDDLYASATAHTVTSFKQLTRDGDQIKQALYQGYPVLFIADVFETFEGTAVGQTGNVTSPQSGEKAHGAHAMMIVGYDDDRQVFIVRNSWGDAWGDQGYCYFPYDYVLNASYTSQFWVLLGVS